MTNSQIEAVTKAVIAALSTVSKKSYPAVKARKSYVNPRISKADVSPKTDRALQRRAAVARGFSRKGIKVTFDEQTGKFANVKPYKVWLSEGRVVMKGQHGVRGLFHVSQTQELAPVTVQSIANPTIGMQIAG